MCMQNIDLILEKPKKISEYQARYKVNEHLYEMLNSVDAYTYNHSVRVSDIARYIAFNLELDEKKLAIAGLFHDIGKYYLSTRVLSNKDITPLDKSIIDYHAYFSYMALKTYDIEDDICKIVLLHHGIPKVFEEFDQPFPFTPSQDISFNANVLRAADIFEALTSDRPYKRGCQNSTAIEYLEDSDIPNNIIQILKGIPERS